MAVTNSVGMIGAYFADGLARVFGSGAFFFPVITAFLGWALIRGKDFRNWLLILGSGILFLIGLCSLLTIQFRVDPFSCQSLPHIVRGDGFKGSGLFIENYEVPNLFILIILQPLDFK